MTERRIVEVEEEEVSFVARKKRHSVTLKELEVHKVTIFYYCLELRWLLLLNKGRGSRKRSPMQKTMKQRN